MPQATIKLQATATVETSQDNAVRSGSRFLVKPMYEGKSHPCYESGFNATRCESVRVNRLENMRLGLEDFTPESFFDLKGKQPLFYFQEMFSGLKDEGLEFKVECDSHTPDSINHKPYTINPNFKWNGLLLYGLPGNKNLLRQIVMEHYEELDVVLAFDDPDHDMYYIVIDTGLEEGTLEEFNKWQQDILDMQLLPLFHKPHAYQRNFYVRALTPDHYDIVNLDALFGQPIKVEGLGCMVYGNETPVGRLKNFVEKIVNIFSTPINHKL